MELLEQVLIQLPDSSSLFEVLEVLAETLRLYSAPQLT